MPQLNFCRKHDRWIDIIHHTLCVVHYTEMVEDYLEVFMDGFLFVGDPSEGCFHIFNSSPLTQLVNKFLYTSRTIIFLSPRFTSFVHKLSS